MRWNSALDVQELYRISDQDCDARRAVNAGSGSEGRDARSGAAEAGGPFSSRPRRPPVTLVPVMAQETPPIQLTGGVYFCSK